MAKSKKVTFKMLRADMPEVKSVEITWSGKNKTYTIDVKPVLSFEEAMEFVRETARVCAKAADVKYVPEAFDFAVKAGTLAYYAGLDIGEDESGAVYDIIYSTDLYNQVREVINEAQYLGLVNAARDKVNYERDSIVSAQGSQMNELLAKMDSVMNDGDKLMEQLSGDELRKNLDDLMRMAGTLEGKADNVVELPLKK